MGERTLIVVRHAKSEWPPGVADIRRPLSERGCRDAPAAGRWLASNGYAIPTAWVSPAARTQQTWALVAAQMQPTPSHVIDDRIYAAHWTTLLEVTQDLPNDMALVGLVGHNPGCEELAAQLAGPGSDADALARLTTKYPTSGVAVLTFDGSWPDLAPGVAQLAEFVIPRG